MSSTDTKESNNLTEYFLDNEAAIDAQNSTESLLYTTFNEATAPFNATVVKITQKRDEIVNAVVETASKKGLEKALEQENVYAAYN